jgi:hypothetical protein
MNGLDKSIDGNAIKGVMYLEQAIGSVDNLQNLYHEELKIAETKGDSEMVDFIKSHMNKLSNIQNKLDVYKDYLNNLVGLSWEAYKQGIEIKKKNDETNPDN